MATRLNELDFAFALFAALWLRGIRTINPHAHVVLGGGYCYDTSVEQAYNSLKAQLEGPLADKHIELEFVVRCHWLHGDSPTARSMIVDLMSFRLVTIDSPGGIIRFRMTDEWAKERLKKSPVPAEVWHRLAQRFDHDWHTPREQRVGATADDTTGT